MQQLFVLTTGLLAVDPVPEDNDVVAGWVALIIFVGLALAVGLLGWALTKQLKRTDANRKAGAFGPVDDENDSKPQP
jgi:hypothetical protein